MENHCIACKFVHDSPKWYNSKTSSGLICKKAYLKEYHSKNKERVNAERRERYHNDPEYKEKIDTANKEKAKERTMRGYKRERKPRSDLTEHERRLEKEAKQRYKLNHPERVIEQNKKTHAAYYRNNVEAIKQINKEAKKTFPNQYSHLKTNARRRDIVVDLTLEQYIAKRTQPCHYCGKELEETGSCLDRIDSNLRVYNDQNTVPCCHICNYLKGSSLTLEETLFAVLALKKFHHDHEISDKINYTMYPKFKAFDLKVKFQIFNLHAEARGLGSNLTFKDFEVLLKYPCFYCGGGSTGLDRLDSTKNYHLDNCVPCCKTCNSIKSDIFSYEETLVMVNAVQKVKIFNDQKIEKICGVCGTDKSTTWVKHPDKQNHLCSEHYKEIFDQKNKFYDALIDTDSLYKSYYKTIYGRQYSHDNRICYQKTIREKRLEEDLASIGKNILNEPIDSYQINMVPFDTKHREFIETYEWLGTIGNSPKWTCEATCNGHLAGVILFNEPASYSKNILNEDTKGLECLIQRGACASWAHKHLGSKMIMFGCRWVAKNTSKKIFVAYSDPAANEIGTIYQACNFDYLGNSYGAKYRYKHSTFKNGKLFSAQSLRRTSVLKQFLKNTGIRWDKSWEKANGFKDLSKLPIEYKNMWYAWGDKILKDSKKVKQESKGKYVLVLGKDRREQKTLNERKLYKAQTYPKRTGF